MRTGKWKPKEAVEEKSLTVPAKYGGALVNPDDIRFPWDQQPYETEIEHALWKLYFDLGPGRSLERLVTTSNRTLEYLHGIAQRCDWDNRATAYHDYLQSVVSTLVEKQITTNRATASRALGEVISHKIKRLHQKVVTEESPNDTVEDILGQLQLMTQIFKTLKGAKGEGIEPKQRTVNIMFAPNINPAPAGESPPPEDIKVTFTEAEVGEDE